MSVSATGSLEEILVLAGLDPTGARVEPLTGGISSETIAVHLRDESFVVKRSLAQLKVDEEWKASPERILAEGHALNWFHALTPDTVPCPVALVKEHLALVLPMAPSPSPDLRQVLLDSPQHFSIEWVSTIVSALRTWHTADPARTVGTDLDDGVRLKDLRLDPFYRDMGARWPEYAAVIRNMVRELLEEKHAVVHGDFTPKNILCLPDDRVWIIDTEVAHIGNPVIDTASMMAHLLLKSIVHGSCPDIAEVIRSARKVFLSELPAISVPPSVGAHTGLFMAVRVAGRAKVPYLSPEQRDTAERVARSLLEGAQLEEVMS